MMLNTRHLGVVIAAALVPGFAFAQANHPPATPGVTEPQFDGRIVNPGDVHMESTAFSDPDPGDTHVCTDWEIWTLDPLERIWATECIGGVERVHTHLGDGIFENSHEGRTTLLYDTQYKLRVRHKDSSGRLNAWSQYGERLFRTGSQTVVAPFELDDIVTSPAPTWNATTGSPVVLPGSATAPFLRLESGAGQLMLEFRGTGSNTNQVINPAGLTTHSPVRVHISTGSLTSTMTAPESQIDFTTSDNRPHTVYVPALNLPPSSEVYYWVSESGATYVGNASQTTPSFTQLARGAPVPWAAQPGYKVEVVASGFQLPVNIAFVPNPGNTPDSPFYYVAELYGKIRVVYRDGTIHDFATNLLNFPPTGNFPGSGEQGLAGLAVEPGTNAVYAGMLYDSTDGTSGVHYPKVVKFTSSDGGRTAVSQTTILDMPGEVQGQSHQISNMTFGPDGKLYVHMGDGFDAARAQDPLSYRGKILRLNPDGTAPTDNPYYNAADGINATDFIYASGFRNPFGGAWRQSDGFHYQVENGPSVDRFCKVVPGRNHLFDGTDQSMANFAILNWTPPTAPVNIAFIQPGTFGGSGFPPDKMDHAFVSLSGPTYQIGPWFIAKRVSEFVLDANGALVSTPAALAYYNGSGHGTAAGLAAGPDGLYFTDLYRDDTFNPIDPGANVLRIKYVGEAKFIADVKRGPGPLTVSFTDQSTALAPVSWSWDFGDGTTSSVRNPTHTYTQPGTYTVRLSVVGSGGPAVGQRSDYIEVDATVSVAFIGGGVTPTSADSTAIAHMRSLGMTVDYFQDADATRPTGAALAAHRNLVVLSGSINSGPILVEFRDVDTPVLFWEPTLLFNQFHGLAGGAGYLPGQTSISVADAAHPIVAGLTGDLSVYAPGGGLNVARAPMAPGAHVVTARPGASGDATIAVVDTNAGLLDGRTSQARQVFFFLDEVSWPQLTPAGINLFDRSVCWAIHGGAPIVVTSPSPVTVHEGDPITLTTTVGGIGPASFTWRRNGTAVSSGTNGTLSIASAQRTDAGSYDAVVANWCGQSTTAPAQVTVLCRADFNSDNQVNSQDFFDFLACFFVADCAAADINHSGVVNSQDFFDFLSAFFGPCQ